MKAIKIILPFLIVAISGCKDRPRAYVSNEVMKIISPFAMCAATKIDTVYDIVNEPRPSCKYGCFGDWQSIGTINMVTGCEIDRHVQIEIYFNPIINHSKI